MSVALADAVKATDNNVGPIELGQHYSAFGFPISGRPSVQQSSLMTPQQCFWGPHHPQGGRHHHQGGQHPHQGGQHPHQGGRHHHKAFFKIVDKTLPEAQRTQGIASKT